jgi:hypothetical protein
LGEDKPAVKRYSTAWKLPTMMAAVPTAFWHQLVIHEGTHGLAVAILGRKVHGFHPYPHKHEGKFYFGRLSADTEGFQPEEEILFSMLPAAMNLILFAGSDVVLSSGALEADSIGGTMLFILGMAAPMVDFTVGIFSGSDWDDARRAAGSKAWALNLAGGIAVGVMLLRAATHTRKIIKKNL